MKGSAALVLLPIRIPKSAFRNGAGAYNGSAGGDIQMLVVLAEKPPLPAERSQKVVRDGRPGVSFP
jgi:hypothetical protein